MTHDQESQYADYLAGFTPTALALADELCDNGLTPIYISGSVCGHGDTYELDPDAPLPDWFHSALADASLTAPEGPWPNWGRTSHPVDWPRLIADHPDVLVPDHDMLAVNGGATWDSIAEAFARHRTPQRRRPNVR